MRKHIRTRILAGILVLFLIFTALGLRSGLTVRRYPIPAGFAGPVRLALVTDLHSCRYGEGMRTLTDAVDAEAPDLVLLGGDIFDDELDSKNAEAFLAAVAERYPCYYVTGNHEYWADEGDFREMMACLNRLGIRKLGGEMKTLTVRGQTFNLCGLEDPDALEGDSWVEREQAWFDQLCQVGGMDRGGRYTVLLTHRPEYFDRYVEQDFDLVLAGHAHGGQWRLPGLLNGLFAPNQGLFPKYAGGEYRSGDTRMIVSRGLARESTRVPRFWNPPELVIVELQ